VDNGSVSKPVNLDALQETLHKKMLEIVKNLSRPELGVFSNKEDLSNKEPLDILNVSYYVLKFLGIRN